MICDRSLFEEALELWFTPGALRGVSLPKSTHAAMSMATQRPQGRTT